MSWPTVIISITKELDNRMWFYRVYTYTWFAVHAQIQLSSIHSGLHKLSIPITHNPLPMLSYNCNVAGGEGGEGVGNLQTTISLMICQNLVLLVCGMCSIIDTFLIL